jgi:hypothetical protein
MWVSSSPRSCVWPAGSSVLSAVLSPKPCASIRVGRRSDERTYRVSARSSAPPAPDRLHDGPLANRTNGGGRGASPCQGRRRRLRPRPGPTRRASRSAALPKQKVPHPSPAEATSGNASARRPPHSPPELRPTAASSASQRPSARRARGACAGRGRSNPRATSVRLVEAGERRGSWTSSSRLSTGLDPHYGPGSSSSATTSPSLRTEVEAAGETDGEIERIHRTSWRGEDC